MPPAVVPKILFPTTVKPPFAAYWYGILFGKVTALTCLLDIFTLYITELVLLLRDTTTYNTPLYSVIFLT